MLRRNCILEGTGVAKTGKTSTDHQIQTFFENAVSGLRYQQHLTLEEDAWLRELSDINARCAVGGAVSFAERVSAVGDRSDVPFVALACSQGVVEPYRWRGVPVYKTVWDLAIYQMLLAHKGFRTVLEIGSGPGGSAMWFADMSRAAGARVIVHTFDISPPAVDHSDVLVHGVDLRHAPLDFMSQQLQGVEHPLLIVEDAHVSVDRSLKMTEGLLAGGDYLVVEDSYDKQDVLAEFVSQSPLNLRVDTQYTDFYGVNATSAMNSIFFVDGASSSKSRRFAG